MHLVTRSDGLEDVAGASRQKLASEHPSPANPPPPLLPGAWPAE